MTVLSPTAVARIAERHIRQAGAIGEHELVAWLRELDLEPRRVEDGLRVAFAAGRLVRRKLGGIVLVLAVGQDPQLHAGQDVLTAGEKRHGATGGGPAVPTSASSLLSRTSRGATAASTDDNLEAVA